MPYISGKTGAQMLRNIWNGVQITGELRDQQKEWMSAQRVK